MLVTIEPRSNRIIQWNEFSQFSICCYRKNIEEGQNPRLMLWKDIMLYPCGHLMRTTWQLFHAIWDSFATLWWVKGYREHLISISDWRTLLWGLYPNRILNHKSWGRYWEDMDMETNRIRTWAWIPGCGIRILYGWWLSTMEEMIEFLHNHYFPRLKWARLTLKTPGAFLQ